MILFIIFPLPLLMAGVTSELEVNLIIIDFYLNYTILLENSKLLGLVTGASEKGTWVRLFQPPVGGKLMQSFESLDIGDRVRVELIGTDAERGSSTL